MFSCCDKRNIRQPANHNKLRDISAVSEIEVGLKMRFRNSEENYIFSARHCLYKKNIMYGCTVQSYV